MPIAVADNASTQVGGIVDEGGTIDALIDGLPDEPTVQQSIKLGADVAGEVMKASAFKGVHESTKQFVESSTR